MIERQEAFIRRLVSEKELPESSPQAVYTTNLVGIRTAGRLPSLEETMTLGKVEAERVGFDADEDGWTMEVEDEHRFTLRFRLDLLVAAGLQDGFRPVAEHLAEGRRYGRIEP